MPTITTHYRGDMTFESVMGNHRILIDVPASMGGGDRGPTPPDLFVASLGSCVTAFVAGYRERTALDTTDLDGLGIEILDRTDLVLAEPTPA